MKRHHNLLIYRDRPYYLAAAGDVDARRSRRIVITGEDVSLAEARAPEAASRQRSESRLSPTRTAALLLTAAFFATTWTLDGQAHDDGWSSDTSVRLAQGSTSHPPQSQAADQGPEHQTTEMQARELAATKRDLAVLLRLLNKACDASTLSWQTSDSEVAELRKALREEHDRAEQMSRELASHHDVEPWGISVPTTDDKVGPSITTADAGSADLRQSLQQQRDRASRLEQDLADSRRDVETQMALATKAEAEASQLKKTADAGTADLRQSLQQERDRASRLEQDLAAARRDVETQTALATKAGAEASQLKKTADAGTADLRQSLQQEHDRAGRLEQDLAAARRDVETQTALATKAGAEASQLKKTADAGTAELRQSLQQERERAAQLERDLALARSKAPSPSIIATDRINAQHEAETAKPVAAEQTAVADAHGDARSEAEASAEIARLVAYARVLVDRGDIGSARIVLQRAADMGNAQASFALAETYDPFILSKWGTYGTRGDAKRALDLYARALAGGIKEAKGRSDALHR